MNRQATQSQQVNVGAIEKVYYQFDGDLTLHQKNLKVTKVPGGWYPTPLQAAKAWKRSYYADYITRVNKVNDIINQLNRKRGG